MIFVSKQNTDAKYLSLSCPTHCDQGLIIIIVYYFSIRNKKEHTIISGRVVSSYISPMNIETLCTSKVMLSQELL